MFGPPDKLLDKLLRKSSTTSHGASAVVTGAGSGIGAAFAVELGRRGGAVVCSDIDEAAAQQTADAITEDGAKAVAIGSDVSAFGDVNALAGQAQDWFGAPPTLVINNAGVGAGGEGIGDVSLDDWSWTLGVNLWGPPGFSATKVARICLDAHDRGELYCMPQLDAKFGWGVKRLAPGAYTRAVGLLSRTPLP